MEAQKISKKTVETLKKIRWDKKYEPFWNDFENKAANLRIDPPKLPRKRRTPPSIEECPRENAAPEFDEYIVSLLRKIYYEALDRKTNFINDHFDHGAITLNVLCISESRIEIKINFTVF